MALLGYFKNQNTLTDAYVFDVARGTIWNPTYIKQNMQYLYIDGLDRGYSDIQDTMSLDYVLNLQTV